MIYRLKLETKEKEKGKTVAYSLKKYDLSIQWINNFSTELIQFAITNLATLKRTRRTIKYMCSI